MPLIVTTFNDDGINTAIQKKMFYRNNRYYLFFATRVGGTDCLYYRHSATLSGLVTATTMGPLLATANRNEGDYYDVYFDEANDEVGVVFIEQVVTGPAFAHFNFDEDDDLDTISEHDCVNPGGTDVLPQCVRLVNDTWAIAHSGSSSDEHRMQYSNTPTPTGVANWTAVTFHDYDQGAGQGSDRDFTISPVGIAGGDVLCIYARGIVVGTADFMICARYWDGTALSGDIPSGVQLSNATQSTETDYRMSKAVRTTDGNVHLIVVDAAEAVWHLEFDYQALTWSTTQITMPAGTIRNPTLSRNITNDFYFYYKIDGTNLGFHSRKYGYIWVDRNNLLTGDLARTNVDMEGSPNQPLVQYDRVLVGWADDDDVWVGDGVSRIYGFSAALRGGLAADPVRGIAPMEVQFTDRTIVI